VKRHLIPVLIMIFSSAECSDETNTAYCRRKKAEKELCMAFFYSDCTGKNSDNPQGCSVMFFIFDSACDRRPAKCKAHHPVSLFPKESREIKKNQ